MSEGIKYEISKVDEGRLDIVIDRLKLEGDSLVRVGAAEEPLSESQLYNIKDSLIFCHSNGCRLDFKKLLSFPQRDFLHDVFGIDGNISHNNGKLQNCFLPKCHYKRSTKGSREN